MISLFAHSWRSRAARVSGQRTAGRLGRLAVLLGVIAGIFVAQLPVSVAAELTQSFRAYNLPSSNVFPTASTPSSSRHDSSVVIVLPLGRIPPTAVDGASGVGWFAYNLAAEAGARGLGALSRADDCPASPIPPPVFSSRGSSTSRSVAAGCRSRRALVPTTTTGS